MDGVGPTSDSGCVLLVDENGSRGQHLGSLLVVRSTANVAKASLQGSFHNGHGVFCGVEEAVPGWLESRLSFDDGARDLMPLRWGGPSRGHDVGSGN